MLFATCNKWNNSLTYSTDNWRKSRIMWHATHNGKNFQVLSPCPLRHQQLLQDEISLIGRRALQIMNHSCLNIQARLPKSRVIMTSTLEGVLMHSTTGGATVASMFSGDGNVGLGASCIGSSSGDRSSGIGTGDCWTAWSSSPVGETMSMVVVSGMATNSSENGALVLSEYGGGESKTGRKKKWICHCRY